MHNLRIWFSGFQSCHTELENTKCLGVFPELGSLHVNQLTSWNEKNKGHNMDYLKKNLAQEVQGEYK